MKINLLALCFLIFTSCDNKNNMNKEINTESNDSKEIQTSNDSLKSTKLKNDKDKIEVDNEIDFEELGFQLMTQETINGLKLGMNIKKVEQIIGETSDLSENELWGADGEYHQTFFYKKLGIELDMIGNDILAKKINMISIFKPCKFKTGRGIKLGSKLSDLEREYGKFYNKDFSNKETYVAGSIYGGVIFTLKNNEVESIFVGAGAE